MKITVPEGRGLVALSGGADSVALLLLLLAHGADVVALHCNFHLRGEESERDERFVRSLCEQRGVALHVRHFRTLEYAQKHGVSVEMAARDLRYAWFEEMRASFACQWIAVAHHREDQAETVLLNLVRGTGLKGLGGMQPRNGYIVRPLLDMSKADLLAYLEREGQGYVTDSTNMEREALRNRIRLDVLPLLYDINPQAVRHICQTAELVRSAEAPREDGVYTLHALYEWLHPVGFSMAQQRDILRDIQGPSGAVYESETHRLLRDRGRLVLEKKAARVLPVVEQRVVEVDDALAFLRRQPLDALHAYLDADRLTLPLEHRFVRPGDAFCPFGMKGRKLVSDLLTDLKYNLFEKERQSVLCSAGDIAWVVGVRSDNRFRVTSATRRVMVLKVVL